MRKPSRRFLNRLAIAEVAIISIAMMGPAAAVEPFVMLFHMGSVVWLAAWLMSHRNPANC